MQRPLPKGYRKSDPLTAFPVSILARYQTHGESETTYTNYEKFQADLQIVSLGEAAAPK